MEGLKSKLLDCAKVEFYGLKSRTDPRPLSLSSALSAEPPPFLSAWQTARISRIMTACDVTSPTKIWEGREEPKNKEVLKWSLLAAWPWLKRMNEAELKLAIRMNLMWMVIGGYAGCGNVAEPEGVPSFESLLMVLDNSRRGVRTEEKDGGNSHDGRVTPAPGCQATITADHGEAHEPGQIKYIVVGEMDLPAKSNPNTLQLVKGDIVVVTKRAAQGWCRALRLADGKSGWFAFALLREINEGSSIVKEEMSDY